MFHVKRERCPTRSSASHRNLPKPNSVPTGFPIRSNVDQQRRRASCHYPHNVRPKHSGQAIRVDRTPSAVHPSSRCTWNRMAEGRPPLRGIGDTRVPAYRSSEAIQCCPPIMPVAHLGWPSDQLLVCTPGGAVGSAPGLYTWGSRRISSWTAHRRSLAPTHQVRAHTQQRPATARSRAHYLGSCRPGIAERDGSLSPRICSLAGSRSGRRRLSTPALSGGSHCSTLADRGQSERCSLYQDLDYRQT